MAGQVIAGPVSAPHALHPAVGCLDLCIPTVTRVVSHLIEEVLTETQLLRVNSNSNQEVVDSSHKVRYCLVGNQTLTGGRDWAKYK